MTNREKVKVRAPIDGIDYDDTPPIKAGDIFDAVVVSREGYVTMVSIPVLNIQYALTNEGNVDALNGSGYALHGSGCAHLKGKALWELSYDSKEPTNATIH
jgi:hypothetical protein